MSIIFSKDFAASLKTEQADVITTVKALCGAARDISLICARGPLEAGLGAMTGDANADGDDQKALDVRADELITAALTGAPVAYYASEEQDDIVTLDAGKPLAVASDPLDGSSNIDTNVSIGTIFSIFTAEKDAKASFFRLGSDQLAGGFFVYGPQTTLIITTGTGTELYVLDPADKIFKLAIAKVTITEDSAEYAINSSNLDHWGAPIRNYIQDCVKGTSGPLARKHNMRWVGSLVADAGRILSRGGIFLYPADDRRGYEHGRLRLLYEAYPVAFVIEQAGGVATDGGLRIMGMELTELHQRVPFVFGSAKPVEMVARYHHQRSVGISATPLFGGGGLLRD